MYTSLVTHMHVYTRERAREREKGEGQGMHTHEKERVRERKETGREGKRKGASELVVPLHICIHTYMIE